MRWGWSPDCAACVIDLRRGALAVLLSNALLPRSWQHPNTERQVLLARAMAVRRPAIRYQGHRAALRLLAAIRVAAAAAALAAGMAAVEAAVGMVAEAPVEAVGAATPPAEMCRSFYWTSGTIETQCPVRCVQYECARL